MNYIVVAAIAVIIGAIYVIIKNYPPGGGFRGGMA